MSGSPTPHSTAATHQLRRSVRFGPTAYNDGSPTTPTPKRTCLALTHGTGRRSASEPPALRTRSWSDAFGDSGSGSTLGESVEEPSPPKQRRHLGRYNTVADPQHASIRGMEHKFYQCEVCCCLELVEAGSPEEPAIKMASCNYCDSDRPLIVMEF